MIVNVPVFFLTNFAVEFKIMMHMKVVKNKSDHCLQSSALLSDCSVCSVSSELKQKWKTN